MLNRNSSTEDRQRQRRHQRHQDEKNVRRQMSEDHRANQPETLASREASSAEMPAKIFAQKKIAAEHRRVDAEAQVEPAGGETLHDEAAAEGVERERPESRKHDAARRAYAEVERRGGACRIRATSDALAEAGKEDRQERDSERGVYIEDHALAGEGRGDPRVRATDENAANREPAAVPATRPGYTMRSGGATAAGNGLRERRLFDGAGRVRPRCRWG